MLVTHYWERIEAWFLQHAPLAWKTYLPGCTEEGLLEAEHLFDQDLPEDFKTSYRIHNGCSSFMNGIDEMSQFFDLHSITRIWDSKRFAWQEGKSNDRAPGVKPSVLSAADIQPVFWHPGWIDFASDGSDYVYCLDLAPAAGGKMGQVIGWDHYDGPQREVHFSGFEKLQEKQAQAPEYGILFSVRRRWTERDIDVRNSW
ncbi:SMI1/KNR4 family protein [Ktedonobacter racemifer]|uniref:Cell wall assembly/cell proliferation coordinating protein, KNR4 n=1 Tax=Ktedonobacter racemifer DSM 44963 TaxID=485913 RepID=D6TBX8_KTERA|nr:SMI1/KNR4 family protein [Ktedonobacter racemifer]EFH88014.1 Cell wall assembly/cell proliferation coordinating protein, KNR4 [Ktedonobacter racemifer DSM 44963]